MAPPTRPPPLLTASCNHTRTRSDLILKNPTNLIHILKTLNVPTNAHLITLDIESLYTNIYSCTNISHKQAITSVLKRLEGHPQKVFTLDIQKYMYVLKNKVFEGNEYIFTQLHGIAMGTKLAPALASIYIGDLEQSFLSSRKLQPALWVRYIHVDDVFAIWPHSLEELDKFLKDLNSVRERIKFTVKINTQSCNFLDLTTYKGPESLNTGRLNTNIYYKHVFFSPRLITHAYTVP